MFRETIRSRRALPSWPDASIARPWRLTTCTQRRHDPRARPRLRSAGRRHGERPLRRERRARLVRAAQGGDGRRGRGPDPFPHARQARHALRAQRVPLSHPLPDLRRARVDETPRRFVQRVHSQVCEGDRRLLRSRARGRPQPGRQAGRVHVRARRAGARRATRATRCARSTSRRTRRTSGSSRPASRARSRGACCRSAPTPSSTGP